MPYDLVDEFGIKKEPILTAKVCSHNGELFEDIVKLYVPKGSTVLDMTYGKGVFWKNLNEDDYVIYRNDIAEDRGDYHYDFRELPEEWKGTFDVVVLDPPYLLTGGWKTLKKSIDRGYRNKERASKGVKGRDRVIQMYSDGFVEAFRVMKDKGILIVKTMDQVESGKQTWLHMILCDRAEEMGFESEDMFVYVMKGTPTMRHKRQLHARRNHSYFLVFKK